MAIKMTDDIGEVLPFRYCEIEGVDVELSTDDILKIAVFTPFDGVQVILVEIA